MNRKTSNAQERHPTIGMLATLIEDTNSGALWAGAMGAAREHDVNLICLPGGELCDPRDVNNQFNIIFEMVSAERMDGLVIWPSAIGTFVTQTEMRDFCRRYDLPTVTVGATVEAGVTLVA